MRILCTGSAGFIGSVVVRKLLALGHSVVGVDSLMGQVHGPQPKKPEGYEFHETSLGFFWIEERFDAVIHLAAAVGVGQSMYDLTEYVANNTLDTAMLLESLTDHKPGRLVVASSMSVYGEGAEHWPLSSTEEGELRTVKNPEPVPTPETHPPHLRSIYALTKYDQEQLSLIWGDAYKVPTVALRFFNTYGPGQSLSNPYTGVLAIFATRLLNGKQPVVYEDGLQTRDFVHVEDVAEAVVRAATTEMEGGVYNVGTGVARTVKSVAEDLAGALDVDIQPVITGQKRAGDIRHCYADIRKLIACGWSHMMTWEDGLTDYVRWLKDQPHPVDKFDTATSELAGKGLVK